jgi:hypothetical protein
MSPAVSNESGIAARAAQHIVAVTQHIVDLFVRAMRAESGRNRARQIHISAQQYDLSRIPRTAQGFLNLSEPSPHEHLTQNHDQPGNTAIRQRRPGARLIRANMSAHGVGDLGV